MFAGVVEEVISLGCGAVGWKPPSNAAEITEYVVRFFDRDSFEASGKENGYRDRYSIPPDQTWAKAPSYPSTKPIYAEVCKYYYD